MAWLSNNSQGINSTANVMARLRGSAAADPRMTQIQSETANAGAALEVNEAEANLNEKNAFTAAQNAALLNRSQRPVGGGTYAELRRRKVGPKGIQMSGLGAANRAGLSTLRRKQIKTQAAGAQAQVYGEHGLNATGKGLNAATVALQNYAQTMGGNRGATVGPNSNVMYPTR